MTITLYWGGWQPWLQITIVRGATSRRRVVPTAQQTSQVYPLPLPSCTYQKPLRPLTFLVNLFKSQNSSSCVTVSCMRCTHLRRNSSVNIVTGQQIGCPRNPSSIAGRCKYISVLQISILALETTQSPARWVPGDRFPADKSAWGVKQTTSLDVQPRLRMSGPNLHYPICLHDRDNFSLDPHMLSSIWCSQTQHYAPTQNSWQYFFLFTDLQPHIRCVTTLKCQH